MVNWHTTNYLNTQMDFSKIKQTITEKSIAHQGANDFEDAELIEVGALDIISTYCIMNKYEINGFPFKLTDKNIDIEEYYELYDSSVFEAYNQYVDLLALEKEDVAELMWHYTNSFWPNQFKSKSEYLEHLKGLLESGAIYEFKL